MTDYRKLSLKTLKNPEYRHLLLVLYWLVYIITFFSIESMENRNFHPISCALDYKIPFCEFFIIPYVMWYPFLALVSVYTLLFDVGAFKKFMYYLILTFSVCFIIYLVFPNSQELRPNEFERDNIFTRTVASIYAADTNTNVFPSMHVSGSLGGLFALWKTKHFKNIPSRIAVVLLVVLICLSTVFLKQHSVLDLFAGAALSLLAYPIIFRKRRAKG